MKTVILSFALLLCLIGCSGVTLPCESIRLEAEDLLTQAAQKRNDRYGAFGGVYNQLQTLLQNVDKLVAAESALLAAYGDYYAGKIACQGLKEKMSTLETAQSLPNSTCYEVPISAQAESLFLAGMELESRQELVAYQTQLVNNYYNYKTDYFNEAGLYASIRAIYEGKITRLQQQYSTCVGGACPPILQAIQAAQVLKQTYENKRYNTNNEATIAEQVYTLENSILNTQKNDLSQAISKYEGQNASIHKQLAECEASLQPKKSILNSALASRAGLQDLVKTSLSDFESGLGNLQSLRTDYNDFLNTVDKKISQLYGCWNTA